MSLIELTLEDMRWVLGGLEDINSGRRRNIGITRNCAVRLREVIERLEAEPEPEPEPGLAAEDEAQGRPA
jgi:hypothetical protein